MLRKKPKSKSKIPKPPKPPAPKDPSTKLRDAQKRKQFEKQSLKYYNELNKPDSVPSRKATDSLKIPKSLKTDPSKDKPKARKIKNKNKY